MVASMRGSSAGRNPTIAIIRFDASSSDPPKYWVNAPAPSDQPRSWMAARISSRVRVQSSTRASPPIRGAMSMARSSATQHIGLEYRKSRGSPRTSQIPWSCSCHRAAAASATWTRNALVASSISDSWSQVAVGPARGDDLAVALDEAL